MSTVTTRLSINVLQSARARRERYVGTWLPEPIATDLESDGARHAETADSLSLAFLVLLERLGPVERAVFVLRDVFTYDYDEIAEIVGKSSGNCRQIAARARRHIDAGRPRFEASRQKQAELSRLFFAALSSGDIGALTELLARIAMALDIADGLVSTVRAISNPDKLRHLVANGPRRALRRLGVARSSAQ